ncbi:MAG: IS5 family transposase [Cytophagales bacterium]|nr:IS5 family transposase [Cytophagales bacterium]
MQVQFTELTDSQWEVLKEILPHQRKRKYSLRSIVNAILWFHRTGVQWRNMAVNFPPWKSVYYYFHRWSRNGVWQKLNDWLVELERAYHGKEVCASLVCIDSQSVKAGPFVSEERGIDGNKKVNGRKRHILVDTLGLILGVVVSAANKADGTMGICLLRRCAGQFARLKKILVDGVYAGAFAEFATTELRFEVEISSRPPTSKGFVPIKKRWVNERTFGWFNFYRRLDKDHEKTTKSSESMVLLANIQLILGRMAE